MPLMRSLKKILLIFCITSILLFINVFKTKIHEHDKEILQKRNTNGLSNFEVKGIKKERDELTELIKLLYQINAFIIDIPFLQELQDRNFKEFIRKIRFNSDFFAKTVYKSDFSQLTFGIFNETLNHEEIVDIFDENLLANDFGLNCQVKRATGDYFNKQIETNIYLICTSIRIQLAVFCKRNTYLWTGADKSTNFNRNWFGDTNRAFNNFEFSLLRDGYSTLLLIPSNVKKFLFDYKYSMFYECNNTIASLNVKILGSSYKQNASKNFKIFTGISYFTEIMQALYKPYFLFGGTLLGWYRDCGIIPHTTDVDFGMFIEDYDLSVKRAFLGNRKLRLISTFGVPEEGLEFRLYNGFFYKDLFFLYKVNQTHMWSGYHGSTRLYKNWYSIFNGICSGELFGVKVLLPCNPLSVIVEDYGANWSLPIESGYGWSSLKHGWKVYDKEKWPKSKKYYEKNGKLDVNGTLEDLNEHVGEEEGVVITNQIIDDID